MRFVLYQQTNQSYMENLNLKLKNLKNPLNLLSKTLKVNK